MMIDHQHSWNISVKEASQIQNQLRNQVELENALEISSIQTIAAADVSFSRNSTTLFAAIVLYSFPDLRLLNVYKAVSEIHFPYIPGYLSFREIPVLLKAFEQLPDDVDLILCDGQGIAHPRRFGLASHVGVLLDKPAIGCAKSLFIGTYEEPKASAGSYSTLHHNNEDIGVVLRTRDNVKPVYVSPGHKTTIQQAREIISACVKKYRIPIPLRSAHIEVNRYRKEVEEG